MATMRATSGVGPPEAEEGIRAEADEDRERQVGAEHVLGSFACGRVRAELVAEPFLDAAELRHERDADEREADSDPACPCLVAGGEVLDGGDDDVRREQEEGGGDDLLCACLGVVGVDAVAGEAPDDDDAGDALDRAVEAVADQGDRVGHDPGGDADRALGGHPCEAEPGDQLDPPDQRCVFVEWEGDGCFAHRSIIIKSELMTQESIDSD